MNSTRKSSGLIILALALVLCVTGCKSKKKAMEAAAEKARIEQEAAARKQQQQDEEMRRKEKEAADAARIKAEADAATAKRDADAKASTPKAKLGQYFDAISNASNVNSANSTISETLGMFSSPETPVLVIISGDGSQKDYDKPTTIKTYLNYLKDQKKNINKIENLQFDNSGKITEVELRKN